MKNLRRALVVVATVIGATAIAIPDPVISKFFIAFATGLNSAAIYLEREEKDER